MTFSFIQPCILFLTWVGGLPLCALYLLIGSMSIVGMVSFFVCSFLHHCLFLFVSILHLHTVYLLVQFLSSLFTSLLFSLAWWWCALVPELPVRFVTPFVPPVGFDPRFLGWRGRSRLEVWGFFLLDCDSMEFGQKKKKGKRKKKFFKKKRKNCACLVFVDILGIIRGGFGFERFLFPLRVGWEHCTILLTMDLGDTLGVRFGFPWH